MVTQFLPTRCGLDCISKKGTIFQDCLGGRPSEMKEVIDPFEVKYNYRMKNIMIDSVMSRVFMVQVYSPTKDILDIYSFRDYAGNEMRIIDGSVFKIYDSDMVRFNAVSK